MSSSARGRAGKYNKPSRGGGKKFSRNLTPLDADGNPVSMWSDPREHKAAASSSEESSDESSEESSDDGKPSQPQEEQTREQRRAAAKARKDALIAKKAKKPAAPGDMPSSSSEESDADLPMPANPNHTAKSRSQAAKGAPAVADAPPKATNGGGTDGLSRREREAVQAVQAKERYQKLHAEGKTDEARADLARLSLIKEKREQDAARKQAEKEEREAAEKKRVDEMDDKERKKREAALGTGSKPTPKKGKK